MTTFQLALMACAVWVGMTAGDMIYEATKGWFGWFGGANWSNVPNDAWAHAWALGTLVLMYWIFRDQL